jgi:hypothetical protein
MGFYVDFVDGAPIAPSEAIPRSEAIAAVQSLGALIEAYAGLFVDDGIASAFREDFGSAQQMRAALASGDRELIRATWDSTTGAVLADDELDQLMALLTEDGSRA